MENPEKGKVVGFTLDADGKKVPVFAKSAGDAPEWQCAGCNEMMGPSAKAYCAKCAEPDGDEDEDEEEAKALGLDPKTNAVARRERIASLVAFEQQVLSATESTTQADARGRIASGAQALKDQPAIQKALAEAKQSDVQRELRSVIERGLSGSPDRPATLSLGRIQKNMGVALRGESKKEWQAAMDKLVAAAEADKTPITASQVIDAACSVQLSAEDLDAVREYVQTSAPVAAPTFIEPARNGTTESEELDQVSAEVSRLANQARAVLDRNSKPAAK